MTDAPERGLRVLAVDDEPVSLEDLAYELRADPRVSQVHTAASATDALAALDDWPIDAVFLDITMPGMDGLALARVLTKFSTPPTIVFVTAHEHHAHTAFELSAIDYLLKPVRSHRLSEAIRRVEDQCRRLAQDEALAGSEPDASAEPNDETIAVERGRVTILLPRSQVTWVEAVGDYVRLHTTDSDYLVRMPISRLEERWESAGFVRIHRSRLVALREIAQMRVDPGRLMTIQLHDGTTLAVSRRHISSLRERLMSQSR